MKNIIITLATILSITVSAFAQKVGIGTSTPTNTLEVVSAVTPGSGSLASIYAINTGTTGNAVWGSSPATNTIGVTGYSINGYGVQGYTGNYIGINGFSLSGTALHAHSDFGYGLIVSGNLKLAGGNTNPSDGAVLTCDPTGNATWKKSNVAFLGTGTTPTPFADGVFKKVEFSTESYDLQNNFLDYNNGITPATSSTFTAPVAGIYHFSSNINFRKTNTTNFYMYYAQIKLVKNGITMAIYNGHPVNSVLSECDISLQIAGDFHLNANDKVWVEAAQDNGSGTSESLQATSATARFSGRLVTAD